MTVTSSVPGRERRFNAPFERAFYNIRTPVEAFIHQKKASGIVLFIFTTIAIIAVNSPLSELYLQVVNVDIHYQVGTWEMKETLQLWVSDGLMGIFFLMVGLEIKREILFGELSSPRKAALPVFAALGGIAFPAIIFSTLNSDAPANRGWAIPVATDIAFVIGVLALLGERIPKSFYIFLITLAVVDDLGAIMIIAIFYAKEISFAYLAKGAVILVLLIAFNLIGIRNYLPYLAFGAFLWFAMLKSGIHATMAGVIIAFTIPSKPKSNPFYFLQYIGELSNRIMEIKDDIDKLPVPPTGEEQAIKRHSFLQMLKNHAYLMESPLHRLHYDLTFPVAFVVMPIFAFTNAGIIIDPESIGNGFSSGITLGVFFGLIVGKFFGVLLSILISVKLGIAKLPSKMTMRHALGGAFLAGMGFTMSMFIAGLAYRGMPEYLAYAKLGILFGSLISGTLGYTFLRFTNNFKVAK
ncbi:MAG: Na+/H+ antiporter NhaA [Nitrospinota bacterium]|nr:Na+/H+ antiporter NhaA [Nitrospinota bacterium]